MKPFVATDTGSYLAEEWTRVLDFQRWFPWFSKTKATRLPNQAKDLHALHEYSMDLFMAGPHFSDAYAGAMRFVALPVVGTLKAPTIVMAQQNDVLHGFLNALPDPLPAGVSKESLAPGQDVLRKRLREIFSQYADFKGAANFVPPDPLKQPGHKNAITNGYVNFPHGQVLVRRAGNGAGRPIVYLSDLPGSTRQDADLLLALAQDRTVYGIDLPGCAESSPLEQPTPQTYADTIARTIDSLGLGQVDVIAEGMSTPLAICFAASHAGQVHKLVLDAVTVADIDLRTEMRINYCADLRPTREGLHLHKAFHMLRDQEVQWPWYDESAAAIRKITPRLDGERLYVRLVDTLKQHATYADAIHATLDVDASALLPSVTSRTFVCTVEDDVRYGMAEAALKGLKNASPLVRPAGDAERANAFLAALD